ncbi:hypothetical protein TNCV_2040341 [Trichonephila clavipes]|nr:hypothetical protein TNCV_2040341 [Trichonephila clavipes]
MVLKATENDKRHLAFGCDEFRSGLYDQFTCRNCGGGDRGRVAIYRPFGEFRRAKSYCHLYGAQGQRQAYLLPMPR